MIILGLVLLIIGFVTGIAILWTIGVIVLVVGPWFGDRHFDAMFGSHQRLRYRRSPRESGRAGMTCVAAAERWGPPNGTAKAYVRNGMARPRSMYLSNLNGYFRYRESRDAVDTIGVKSPSKSSGIA